MFWVMGFECQICGAIPERRHIQDIFKMPNLRSILMLQCPVKRENGQKKMTSLLRKKKKKKVPGLSRSRPKMRKKNKTLSAAGIYEDGREKMREDFELVATIARS
jgi:hypothetical protein